MQFSLVVPVNHIMSGTAHCIIQIQELRGNIRVFCRCRHDDRGSCAPRFQDEDKLFVTTHQGRHEGLASLRKSSQPDVNARKGHTCDEHSVTAALAILLQVFEEH